MENSERGVVRGGRWRAEIVILPQFEFQYTGFGVRMNANQSVEYTLNIMAEDVGKALDATPLAIIGPILGDLDMLVREAVESVPTASKKARVAIVLDTGGGVVELVEQMVNILRHHFRELHFVIPDRAMSAGTIFALSGDSIWMDYASCLGPIDPQIEKDGKLVPALSYVVQYEQLVEKSRSGDIAPAEYILLQKLDLADLHSYQQARDLSVSLLEEWLSTYKFKDWVETEARKLPVDVAMRQGRAREIAHALSNHTRWKSHGRPISMAVWTRDLNIRIDDMETNPALRDAVRLYFNLLVDYGARRASPQTVHTPGYCS